MCSVEHCAAFGVARKLTAAEVLTELKTKLRGASPAAPSKALAAAPEAGLGPESHDAMSRMLSTAQKCVRAVQVKSGWYIGACVRARALSTMHHVLASSSLITCTLFLQLNALL